MTSSAFIFLYRPVIFLCCPVIFFGRREFYYYYLPILYLPILYLPILFPILFHRFIGHCFYPYAGREIGGFFRFLGTRLIGYLVSGSFGFRGLRGTGTMVAFR